MTAHAIERCHGLRQIVRFNWPFYAVTAAVVAAGPLIIPRLPAPTGMRAVLFAMVGLAAFWTIGSLAASWLVYDWSNLMTGDWIRPALGYRPRTWLTVHAGHDELTPIVRARLPGTDGRVFDIFDAGEMTEPSIARARHASRLSSSPTVEWDNDNGAESADFRDLPVPTASMDAAFLLLSAHELRTHEARCALFREIHRSVIPGRRVIVAEHLRDGANLAAFGPGAMHFHSGRAWMRCYEDTGFGLDDEFSITPFVHVFVLRRLS